MDVAHWYAARHPAGHQRFIAEIESALEMLAAFPFAGRRRDDIAENLRSWPVHPFVVFYVVNEGTGVLSIARVLHGHRDITADEFDDEIDNG